MRAGSFGHEKADRFIYRQLLLSNGELLRFSEPAHADSLVFYQRIFGTKKFFDGFRPLPGKFLVVLLVNNDLQGPLFHILKDLAYE